MDLFSQEKIVEKYSGQLQKLAARIPGYFKEKDIHDWRVAYKKLRAFLRMITVMVNGHVPLMTKDIRKMYAAAGETRQLSLYLSVFESNVGAPIESYPAYTGTLNKQLFAAKENFTRRLDVFSFENEMARWNVMLPGYLTSDIIKTFLQKKITAIGLILLVADNDETLHALRKHLKDIIYNYKIFSTDWGIPFPVKAWDNEKVLIDIAEELGDYNDRCFAITYLEGNYTDLLPENEKYELSKIREHLLAEKQQYQQKVIRQIKQLSLSKIVKEI